MISLQIKVSNSILSPIPKNKNKKTLFFTPHNKRRGLRCDHQVIYKYVSFICLFKKIKHLLIDTSYMLHFIILLYIYIYVCVCVCIVAEFFILCRQESNLISLIREQNFLPIELLTQQDMTCVQCISALDLLRYKHVFKIEQCLYLNVSSATDALNISSSQPNIYLYNQPYNELMITTFFLLVDAVHKVQVMYCII